MTRYIEYFTIMRPGRLQRLHTTALLPVMSPLATPNGICGRILSDVTIAGAATCACPDFDNKSAATIPPPVRVQPSRNRRRFSRDRSFPSMN
ncbi:MULTISPECIES: hypothetical protein [unclassified Coleofasciculus]|uniref:hypothetical protein n=1 Tax=Cyanophyceae TaxID=3028117 RepID=UPI0032201591